MVKYELQTRLARSGSMILTDKGAAIPCLGEVTRGPGGPSVRHASRPTFYRCIRVYLFTMSEKAVADAHAELIRDIKASVASLKTSVDRIVEDMNGIRGARLEILDRVEAVKNESVVNRAQIQTTLVRAKMAVKKSEENRKRLEILLKKMGNMNLMHTFTCNDPRLPDVINGNVPCECLSTIRGNKDTSKKRAVRNINVNQEKIKLQLLGYGTTCTDSDRDDPKEKSDFKWGRDSTLKELHLLLKVKLYKLRHHYDRLPEIEERASLPLSWNHP
ncbi:hypothetical protein J6590_049421 [Homalodisca vitripennis]|nr:hypothetical protein J6590_049421 [Homalodisca vitripennis]